jgi:hypothetical protein
MHILNLEALRAILPLLYFFRPSGLDDISRPIQELAVAPYAISEAQRGVIHGATSYASLPPVTQVFRTSGPRPPVLVSDPPKPNPEDQHPGQTPCATRSPCVDFHVVISKPLVQPTCSRSDAPDLANVSMVLPDMSITHGFSHSLSARGAIWTLAAVSVLLMFQEFVSMVCYFYSADSSVATIYIPIYILSDFALCGILDNFRLAPVLLALWQGFVRGGIIVGTLCSFCRMVCKSTVGPVLSIMLTPLGQVWSLWQHINLDDLSEDTTTPTRSTMLASPQSCAPDNGYLEISIDLETMPMMAECSMRTNVVESSISTDPGGATVQPGVVGTEAVAAGMDTQSDRVTVFPV